MKKLSRWMILLMLTAGFAFAGGSSDEPSEEGSGEPLEFYAWSFMPDKIDEYNEYFAANYDEQTNVHIIPNLGYVPAIQVKIMGGVRMDVMYNFSWNQQRWINVGWAAPLSDLPGADEIVADIIDSAQELYHNAEGELISLPYFMAPFVNMYNERLFREAGYDRFPVSKQELYEACAKLKTMGVDNPYVAYWNRDFVDRYFFIYLLSEGITTFDENFDPVFQNNPDTARVFEWWTRMFQDGMTSPTILTDTISGFGTMMQEGEAAVYNLHHYFLKGIVEAEATESANIIIAPNEPGEEGTVLLIGEVLQLGGNSPDPGRAWELLKFYSWKNAEGEYYVPKTWAIQAGLLEPYKGFFQDPEIVSSFESWIDWDVLMDVVNDNSKIETVRQQIWYPEWRTEIAPLLHEMIAGDLAVQDAVDQIADAAVRAKLATQ